MAHFDDFSEYVYFGERYVRPNMVNIGWLEHGESTFETEKPTESFLDALWSYCTILVVQTRGIHRCDFCEQVGVKKPGPMKVERHGLELPLGTSEIRVFGEEYIFAAPNLIYHYVEKHHYRPPSAFMRAVLESAKPPDEEYFELLKEQDLSWDEPF